jgi:hypothetical protein
MEDTCTPRFIAGLYTITKIRYQLRCPSMSDGSIKKMRHLITMEHYSTIKKNELLPFVGI